MEYKTKSGLPVKIYAEYGDTKHGAYYFEGEWKSTEWTGNENKTATELNLVENNPFTEFKKGDYIILAVDRGYSVYLFKAYDKKTDTLIVYKNGIEYTSAVEGKSFYTKQEFLEIIWKEYASSELL
jgi:hypothetical protein